MKLRNFWQNFLKIWEILEKLIKNFEKVWENLLKIMEKFFVQNQRKNLRKITENV